MSDEGLGWEPLLMTDSRPGAALKAALFTTYDRADETFATAATRPAYRRALARMGFARRQRGALPT